ncbi:uncharacterized protein LOC135696797 [Rhopilema esculentum]|uniref:uncharacterized protein LOC135696797 n=1 Tax=Rhopilema esculentum TaxID=499914 RepID=UPI0031D21FF8
MNEAVQLFEGQLSVITRPLAKQLGAKEVLIKVSYAGVCGTDLHILSGEFPVSKSAVVLGHEFCGVAEDVGTEVKHIKPGERVVVNPNSNCDVCRYCTRGDPHFCKIGGIRSTVGIWKNGGWATYCKVSAILVHPLPEEIPMSFGVFCEPFSCLIRGWENMQPLRSDSSILVVGAGIIGLLWASIFHFRGFRDFVVMELSEKRRAVACNLGLGLKVVHPDHLFNQYQEAKRDGNDDWGFDVIVDCTGSPKAIEQEFLYTRRGAKLVLFGCCPEKSEIKIDPFEIYNKELVIIGSHINPNTFPKAIKMVKEMGALGYLDFQKICTKKFSLQDYPAALDALRKGEIAKAVFEINSETK